MGSRRIYGGDLLLLEWTVGEKFFLDDPYDRQGLSHTIWRAACRIRNQIAQLAIAPNHVTLCIDGPKGANQSSLPREFSLSSVFLIYSSLCNAVNGWLFVKLPTQQALLSGQRR